MIDPCWPDEKPKKKLNNALFVGAWFLCVIGCVLFWGGLLAWFLK